MTDLAESLVEQGVEVTALAGRGRYNGGGESLPVREVYRGVRIERAWTTRYGKGNPLWRLADYLSFYLGASWKLLTLPRHDIVMALTTPPLIGLVALLVGRLRGMRTVALVQDMYPEVAVALGTLRAGSLFTRVLEWLSRRVLRGADRIVVLGECMRERVTAKLGAEYSSRIDVIHNWADGEKIRPLDGEKNPFREEHGLSDSFVVIFSGNLGRVNEFTTVLEAARCLREREDVVFVFIGDGAKAGEIKSYARQHGLGNVRLLPYQSRESLRYSLAAGDAQLVTLAEGLAGLSVPSKTYAVLAAGRPVLFVGDPRSDVARLVLENECGAVTAAGDADGLSRIIATWAANRAHVKRLGAAAREVFERRFERAHAVGAYLQTFNECMAVPPRSLRNLFDAKA